MEVVRTLRGAPAWLTDVAELVTVLGDQEFYLLAGPLVYWSLSRRTGLHLVVILLLSASLNAILKLGLAAPRPGYLAPELAVVEASGYALPSGHAQNAAALWGLLAAELRSRWWVPAAVLLVLVVGWTRLQLGVHSPVDTVTGFVVGGLLLVVYLRLRRPVATWSRRRPTWERIGTALGVVVVLVALGAVARFGVGGSAAPAAWVGVDPADPPYSLEPVVVAAATLAGVLGGLVLLERRGGFETDGAWWQRALRYPVGLLGVATLYVGLGSDPTGDDVLALALRCVQYGLVGLWISGVAPLLFVRLRLAPSGSRSGC